jgi:MFS family permease
MTPTAGARQPNLRLAAVSVAAAFMFNGASFGIWAARIPAVKAQTGLDSAGLGFALLGASVGAVLTMTAGGWLGSKFGTHVMTPLTTVGCAVMTVFIGASFNFVSLILSLLVFGVFQGTMDVSMNANGIAVERAGAGPIMSRLHASWSIGAFFGALVSTQVAAMGIPVLPEFAVAAAVFAIGGVVLRFTMLPDKHVGGGARIQLPTGPLVLLGVLAVCGLMAESSATDWSGVYLQSSMQASQGVAGLAVTVFTGSMAVARLAGDRLSLRLGSARLVSGGAALAALGLGLALAVQIPAVAIVGFGMMGLGLAAVVPTLFRAAGSQPGIPASVGIAAVSTMGYAGGLVGPPVIGTVAEIATLRGSLAIILGMLVILVIAGRRALAAR